MDYVKSRKKVGLGLTFSFLIDGGDLLTTYYITGMILQVPKVVV